MDKKEKLNMIRHSCEHLYAQAITELFPNKVRLAVAHISDEGFANDAQIDEKLSEKDFKMIEKKMKHIVKQNLPFIEKEITEEKAREIFKNNPFKLRWLAKIIEKGGPITVYYTGDLNKKPEESLYVDLCKGPHVKSTGELKAFKLLKISGAYWEGKEENEMLTRVYGTAFESRDELQAHLKMLEEAKKRDHRVIGAKLKLFTISKLIGAGLPLMQPAGMIMRQEIENYLWKLHKTKGYTRVWTPHIAKECLYETSGHAAKFGDELFRVKGKEESFILKPMNCPHHMQIFADNQFSYRDMPIRYFEPATVYRDEKSGQLGGLTRVRAITQDDGHLFCRINQIKQEVKTITEIIKEFYTTLGMTKDYWVSLSVRGDDKTKYLGSDDVWEKAEESLESAAKENKLPYKRIEGEAAFYGPKLDFMFKDAIGREWQLATIQCDFNLPERFELEFTNEKGEKERPVVIHRAISGSLERGMGVFIEHFAGVFPLWMAPRQVKIVPVSEKFFNYAEKVEKELNDTEIRVTGDYSSDGLNKKVRNAEKMHNNYILVVGEKEESENTVSVRNYKTKEQTVEKLKDFSDRILKEIEEKSL